jgi:hypothetical protein
MDEFLEHFGERSSGGFSLSARSSVQVRGSAVSFGVVAIGRPKIEPDDGLQGPPLSVNRVWRSRVSFSIP